MTKKEATVIVDKIIEGMKSAISELYEQARKNNEELVVYKDGKIQRIKVS